MLPASASSSPSPSPSDSVKRLSNGKFACLACPHRLMHNGVSRHIVAESRLREIELSRQLEINKILALSSAASFSNIGNPHPGVRPSGMQEKPLIEQTRRAILEA